MQVTVGDDGTLQGTCDSLPTPFNPPFAARFDHFSVWKGKSLIVSGRCAELGVGPCIKPLMDGFVYTPDEKDATKDVWQ